MNIEDSDNPVVVRLLQLADADVSSSARLVAVAHAVGVTSPSDVAKLIGKSDRMERHARQEIAALSNGLPATDCQRQQITGNGLPDAATDCRPSRTHERARFDSPSSRERLSVKVVGRGSHESEIEGLNGDTAYFVDLLAGWLAGDHKPKDTQAAERVLIGYVASYGADRVKRGMSDLGRDVASGKRRNPLASLPGFIERANVARDPTPPSKPDLANLAAVAAEG